MNGTGKLEKPWANPYAACFVTLALVLGLGSFVACWLLHVVIWRVRRPTAYPIWLPILFLGAPTLVGAALVVAGFDLSRLDPSSVIAGALLHVVISGCYMGGYAGVIEYSPSAEILRAVRAGMPQGLPVEALNVGTLSEGALTGKRVAHLRSAKMVEMEHDILRLSPKGRLVVTVCRVYRSMFGLREDAKG